MAENSLGMAYFKNCGHFVQKIHILFGEILQQLNVHTAFFPRTAERHCSFVASRQLDRMLRNVLWHRNPIVGAVHTLIKTPGGNRKSKHRTGYYYYQEWYQLIMNALCKVSATMTKVCPSKEKTILKEIIGRGEKPFSREFFVELSRKMGLDS